MSTKIDNWHADKLRKGNRPLFQYWYRKCNSNLNGRLNFLYRIIYRVLQFAYKVEIPRECQIGGGLYIGHPYGITINGLAKIGRNCNIHKGVTIGQENRGHRKGVPIIGDEVWMGINSTIVGAITIGNDVLIAPNTFVNCDVPSHSIVFGNPCIIKHKEHATKDYICNLS